MPAAGDEGYEKLVICPYDKSHEIRKGRMQFHLDKCRKNFPTAQMIECPFNSSHIVPKVELEYHTEEECRSRATWEHFTYTVGSDECPVKDLVPVNAGTLPDCSENWDNFEAKQSPLDIIKAEAPERSIFRMAQCVSKSKRKAFRAQERLRHSELQESSKPESVSNTPPVPEEVPVSKAIPTVKSNLPRMRQKSDSLAVMAKRYHLKDKNTSSNAPSESSITSGPPSEYETASTSKQTPVSFASMQSGSTARETRPSSAMSGSSSSMMTALSNLSITDQKPGYYQEAARESRPSTAMSGTSSSMMTAKSNPSILGQSPSYSQEADREIRPPSSMSGNSMPLMTAISNPSIKSQPTSNSQEAARGTRPPSVMSGNSMSLMTVISNPSIKSQTPINSRPSTAMSILESVNRASLADDDGFCQIPIPGLGRGRRRIKQ